MQREVILAVGRTGYGKTTWTNDYIKKFSRVIVADAGFGDYSIRRAGTYRELCDSVQRGFFRVSYDTQPSDWPFVFECARTAGEMGGPLHLVMEEAYRAGDPRLVQEYSEAINQGRHWGLSIIAVSTRAAKIPTDFKAQVSKIIAFGQNLPNDVEYLSEFMGDAAERLRTLPRFHYLEWTPDGKIEEHKLGHGVQTQRNSAGVQIQHNNDKGESDETTRSTTTNVCGSNNDVHYNGDTQSSST